MKAFPNENYRGPLEGLVFDMDNTLYTNPPYARHQEDVLVARLAQEKGWNLEYTKTTIDVYRNEYARLNQGHLPSLGNTFLEFGISIIENAKWRNQEICVDFFLSPDPVLQDVLSRLAKDFRLAVVTNNPVELAQRTLDILGVSDFVSSLVGLDTLGLSKPHPPSFVLAARLMGCEPHRCMTVGDRYGVDISPGLEVGMVGLLVTGVEEIYTLPEYIRTMG